MKKTNHLDLVTCAIIVGLGLSASVAVAQGESTPTSTVQRVRRVEPERLISNDAGAQGVGAPDERMGHQVPPSGVASEIQALREQVDAPPNAEEKAQLQFKLVDRLVAAGMKEQAIAELSSMLLEDRFDPQGFYNIGNAFARLGDSEGAVKAYRKAIEQRKGRYARALNNLGVLLLRQGRWEDASEALLNALRLENFHYAEASYNLGRLYAARGETDLAIREWRRALTVNPEHSAAAEAIGGARRGRNITIVSRSSPGRSVATDVTRVAEEPRSPKSGSTSSRVGRVLTVDPETYRFLQRARTARDRGRNEEAVENYRRVISRMGGYFPPANLELSYSLINLRRNDEALASLLSLADKDGTEFPISHYHIGRIYESKGELRLAEDRYSRAAASDGDQNAQFLLDVSRVREKLGDFSGALIAMEHYVELMGRRGQKLDWSEERISQLRQQLGSKQSTPTP